MAKTVGTNDLIEVWGSTGTATEPSVAKITGGWQFQEQPPFETMNWVHNHLGEQVNYLMRSGVPAWNAATPYLAGDAVIHSGSVWIATTGSTNSTPADANTDWSKVPGVGDLATIATTGDPTDLVGVTASASELNVLDGLTASTAELNFVDGVTGSIQTQINGKLEISSKATTSQAQTGTNDTEYMTPLKVQQAIDTNTTVSVGEGQTWQNLSGSRSAGVDYQNTTGRAIQVMVSYSSGNTATGFQVSNDGITWFDQITSRNGGISHVSPIIPDNGYYRVLSGITIEDWLELR